jgi:uncharacterized protein (TIGR00255 family)
MTGFGRATADLDGLSATVELRSVNNRFCEVLVRAPRELSRREHEIQSRVKQEFARGRINVNVQIERPKSATSERVLNRTAAKKYARLLKDLRKAGGVSDRVRLEHLLAFPEVFSTSEVPEDDEIVWKVTSAALSAAMDGLKQMRVREGQSLKTELVDRLMVVENLSAEVDRLGPDRVVRARERLHERLSELVGDERLNPERLELEIAILADKLDTTEELVRLRSHIGQFREAIEHGDSVGRKLNFIVQEINREVNTIGSKANDGDITRLVVSMKEELEKIREQIENVE